MISNKVRKLIEEKYGNEIRYPKDCDSLAAEMSAKTGMQISSSTLKRILGFIRTESKPNRYTLDTVAKYIGYKDWDELIVLENQPEIIAKVIKPKPSYRWVYLGLFIFILSIVAIYFLLNLSEHKKDLDKLKSKTDWFIYDSLPEVRSGGRAILLNEFLYYVGGHDAEFSRDNNWRLDLLQKEWTNLPPMLVPLAETGLASDGEKLYCFGGWMGNKMGMTDFSQEFDIKNNLWDTLPKLPVKLTSLNATYFDSSIYILGGSTEDTKCYFFKYSISKKEYDSLPSMSIGRLNGSLVKIENLLYYIGGNSFTNGEYHWHNEVDVFDMDKEQWIKKRNLPVKLTGATAFYLNGKIHLIGGTNLYGENDAGPKNYYFIYDLKKDKWSKEKAFIINLSSHQSILWNNAVFIMGGNVTYPNPEKLIYRLNF